MPNLPKQPKPQNPAAIRQAWADEHTAARQARADGDPFRELPPPRAGPHPQPALRRPAHPHPCRRCSASGSATETAARSPGSSSGSSSPAPAPRSRRYPLGNTGGAAVSAVEPMDIPTDLQVVLAPVGAS